MISPRSRLIFLATVTLLPALTLFFAVPTLSPFAEVIVLLFVLAVVIDAWFMQPDLGFVQIVFPELIRLSKGRDGQIEIKCVNNGAKLLAFRLGIPFAPELGAANQEFDLRLEG